MLFYNIKNYEEFKTLFGTRKCNNGNIARRNKILLAFLLDNNFRKIYKDSEATHKKEYWSCKSITELKTFVTRLLNNGYLNEDEMVTHSTLQHSFDFWSHQYKLDAGGICEDLDARAVRYINLKTQKVFKMKTGKFFRKILEENTVAKHLPEQVKIWFCETITEEWAAYCTDNFSDLQLNVDDDFEAIYDGNTCSTGFGSCMEGKYQYSYYSNAIEAKAASLTNNEGVIVARCIVYTKVTDMGYYTGRKYRLAERQYAESGSNILKQILVNKLIEGGYIDGYKKVGVDCHASTSFISNNGEDWSDRDFSIRCCLERGDTLSYQDSFKYYDYDNNIAYNHCDHDYSDELDTTDDRFDGGEEYDDYHDCYCSETRTVSVHGEEMQCDVEDMGDFIWIDSEQTYFHEDDVAYCNYCDRYYLREDCYYSEITGQDYCSEYCREQAEQDYKELNWYYSDYDEEYFESKSGVTYEAYLFSRCGLFIESVKCSVSIETLSNLPHVERDGYTYYSDQLTEEEIISKLDENETIKAAV